MRKLILGFMILIPLISINAQWDLSASMGLDFRSSPSYRDYVNANFAPQGSKLASFNSAVNFSGEIGYLISPKFQLGFEYSILIDSYNTSIGAAGLYDISYTMLRPSIIGYYVISGKGYKFKFGGGFGLRSVSLDEKISTTTHYSASGTGILLKADGNTLLSDNLYVLIGVDLRYDIPGVLSTKGNAKITNSATGEAVNMNAVGVGIKLGVTYTF